MRNSSPAFNNPVYQTSSVVPSKRPRPREDSLGTSPRQAPGMLPNSRSQTPQQGPYPGFPANNQLQQHASQPTPTPYSHLQHNGSANASPSPILSNQLRSGAVPQRVSTASPHPFSPAAQQFGQGSPSQSDSGGRVETPQNPYMQNPAFASGYNQAFTPPSGRTPAPPPGPMSNPQMQQMGMQQPPMYPPQQQQRPNNLEQQQKMMYQMRLQQQLQQSNLLAAQRMQSMPQNQNPMAKPPIQAVNGQYPPGMRPQQAVSRPNNPEQFMKHLTTFMQSRGLTLDVNPIVGDRAINIVMLYMAVAKFGGYKRVNQQNGWHQVAQTLSFNPMQNPSAPQQIKGHYERNLMSFEDAYNTQQQQRQRAMMQQNANVAMGAGHPQMSPTKSMNPQNPMQQSQPFMQGQQQQQQQGHIIQQQHPLQSQIGPNTPVKQMTPMNTLQQPNINGFSNSQPIQTPNQLQASAQAHVRNNLSRSIDTTAAQNGSTFATPTAASAGKRSSLGLQSPHQEPSVKADPNKPPGDFEMDSIYEPAYRILNTWGGVSFSDEITRMVESLVFYKPNVPTVSELGMIDVHALTMSLQSGIHVEVRLALDTLATLSVDRTPLELTKCEDLVETLIDCAEVQIELLAENAAEVSDVMLINSYEDVVRGARIEQEGLQDTPAFGTLDYDMDRSVERLICIATIMRNLSFYEPNQHYLADGLVIKFLCVVIRYLGTRNMLLRTQTNTLDFIKDVIILLSNLAHTIEIPGREQALCLLHFLLAFAPCPPPNVSGPDKVIFSPYDPAVHRYLPAAVDSLAKLLARDEPNRTFYKAIFASDATSTPPYDLLTKAFALAISPIPGHGRDEQRGYMNVVEARKPLLMQGMLAAEMLSNFVPGFEAHLARSWLQSEDGFAQSLLRLVTKLSLEAPTPAPSRGPPVPHRERAGDDEALLHITLSGITVLRRLVEKSQHSDGPSSAFLNDGMIKKDMLLGALLMKQPAQPRSEVIKQLCLYASLDS
jgi:SWI/SNF chromatin-remodeling complex subunit SWI1